MSFIAIPQSHIDTALDLLRWQSSQTGEPSDRAFERSLSRGRITAEELRSLGEFYRSRFGVSPSRISPRLSSRGSPEIRFGRWIARALQRSTGRVADSSVRGAMDAFDRQPFARPVLGQHLLQRQGMEAQGDVADEDPDQRLIDEIDDLLNSFCTGGIRPIHFSRTLDDDDFAFTTQMALEENLRRVLAPLFGKRRRHFVASLQSRVDARLPEVWEGQVRKADFHRPRPWNMAEPQLVVNLRRLIVELTEESKGTPRPSLEDRRLLYLCGRYASGDARTREDVAALFADYARDHSWAISRFITEAGRLSLPRGLTVAAMEIILARDGTAASHLIPPVWDLPRQLRIPGVTDDEILGYYRQSFAEGVTGRGGADPQLLAEAMIGATSFWRHRCEVFLLRAGQLFQLAERYRTVVPGLDRFLAESSPQALWDRFDFPGVARSLAAGESIGVTIADDLLIRLRGEARRVEIPFDPYLEPLRLPDGFAGLVPELTDDSGWQAAGAWGRGEVLHRLGVGGRSTEVPRLLDVSDDEAQLHLDLFTTQLRRVVVAHYASHFESDPATIEGRLPDFSVDVAEVLSAHERLRSRVDTRELVGNRYVFVGRLRDVARIAGAPTSPRIWNALCGGALLPPESEARYPFPEVERGMRVLCDIHLRLDLREGYDRHGALGTLRRTLMTSSIGPDARPQDIAALADHYVALIRHYASREDLVAEEVGREIRGILIDAWGLSRQSPIKEHAGRNRGHEFYGVAWSAVQLSAIREARLGRRFSGPHAILEYATHDLSWNNDADEEECRSSLSVDWVDLRDHSLDQRLHAVYSFDVPGYTGYDCMGTLTQERREELMGRMLQVSRTRPAIDIKDYQRLGKHWRTVLATLLDYAEPSRAQEEVVRVHSDIARVHERIKHITYGQPNCTRDVIWEARQVWTLLAIRSGERFAGGYEDLLRRLIAAMPEVARHNATGFLRTLTQQTSMPEPRSSYAGRIREHFHGQRFPGAGGSSPMSGSSTPPTPPSAPPVQMRGASPELAIVGALQAFSVVVPPLNLL